LDAWEVKSVLYRRLRDLPYIRRILTAETNNCNSLLQNFPIEAKRILDVGSGTGSTLAVYPDGITLICIDRSTAMLRQLRKVQSHHVLPARADATALPVRSASFGFVSAIGLSEYLVDLPCLLKEVKRVLKPGGFFLVTVSPPGFLTAFRNVLGIKIHAISSADFEGVIRTAGFLLWGKRRSTIQYQYLLQSNTMMHSKRMHPAPNGTRIIS